MSFELRILQEAERSIDEQLDWYKTQLEEGTEFGNRWFHKLLEALNTLREGPERFGFAPENGRWKPDLELRQMKFRPWKTGSTWRVLFIVEEQRKIVTVVQIRHASRKRLYELDDE